MSNRRKIRSKNKDGKYTLHHLRPRSRGGMDNKKDYTNVVELPHETIHDPYHTLFSNLRPHEVLTLLLLFWHTVCPHIEKKEPHTNYRREEFKKRIKAWDTLFYKDPHNRKVAIETIIRYFIFTKEDIELAATSFCDALYCGRINKNDFDNFMDILNS